MLQVMSKKVLIVEDNELNMKLFRDLLEAHGFETVQTREGLKALDMAREHQPDLTLDFATLTGAARVALTSSCRKSPAWTSPNGSRTTKSCVKSPWLPSPPSP